MAVMQAAFHHRNASANRHLSTFAKIRGFSHQFRRLLLPEGQVWQTEEDTVIEWGDPAHMLNPETLAKANLAGHEHSVFGRSWVHYHRPTHSLTLAVDRLGLFPILLAQRGQATYIASDAFALSQLLGDEAESESEALLELLAYGQLLGEQSSLRGVKHLHAGSVCHLNAEGSFQLWHETPYYLPRHSNTEAQACEAVLSAVDKRMQRDPDAVIPIDGNPDVRLLIAAAYAAGHRPRLLSYGFPGSRQLQLAQAIAEAVGADLLIGALDDQQFYSAHAVSAQLSGGEVPLHHVHPLICSELVARTRGATLITSTGSELYRNPSLDTGFTRLGLSGFKHNLFKNAQAYALESLSPLLTPFLNALGGLRDYLYERMNLRLSVYQSRAEDAAHYLEAVYLGERVRRQAIAEQQILIRDYARSHPFLDEDVLLCLAGLSQSQRLNGRFYRHAIAKFSPRLSDLNWDASQHPWTDNATSRLVGHTHLGGWCHYQDNSQCLEYLAKDTNSLRYALLQVGLNEAEAELGVNSLLEQATPAHRLHLLGVLGAYNLWQSYLLTQRATARAA